MIGWIACRSAMAAVRVRPVSSPDDAGAPGAMPAFDGVPAAKSADLRASGHGVR
jgi:hypothetical protein